MCGRIKHPRQGCVRVGCRRDTSRDGANKRKGVMTNILNVECESDGRKLVESDGLKLVESDGAGGCGIFYVLWKQIRVWERQDGVHETAPARQPWRWCRI